MRPPRLSRRRAAVIGDPIRHSLSPRLFSLLSRAMNRPLEYRARSVRPAGLERAVSDAKASSWLGWNVTAPHKVAILPHLDHVRGCAREAGAVNVVRFEDGRSAGYNTDLEGFLAPLRRMGFRVAGKSALVLGSGGAARAVCAALKREGARRILVLARSAANAARVARRFSVESGSLEPAALKRAARRADLVVNATTLGMGGRGTPLPSGVVWKRGALAYDLVYRPRRTPFLRQAGRAGARTLGGLPMLVAQAAATWTLWFGEDVPPAAVSRVERELDRALA